MFSATSFRIATFLVLAALLGRPCGARAETPEPPALTADRAPANRITPPEFWKEWGDGKAELSGYSLRYPRYGAPREGTAVTIFVTEPFSRSLRVKADPGKHPAADELQVMKLNLVKHFQTGIYDYHLMTSTFLALSPFLERPEGSPAKVAFSAHEWCGQVFHELRFLERSVESTLHSYFDGEADSAASLIYPPDGVSEDTVLLWARGLAAPFLAPGERRSVPFLPSLERSRLTHTPIAWGKATFERQSALTTLETPAGSFVVETRSVTVERGDTLTLFVEAVAPYRIIRWKSSSGEEATLRKSARLRYWEMNGPQFVPDLSQLGLEEAELGIR